MTLVSYIVYPFALEGTIRWAVCAGAVQPAIWRRAALRDGELPAKGKDL